LHGHITSARMYLLSRLAKPLEGILQAALTTFKRGLSRPEDFEGLHSHSPAREQPNPGANARSTK